MDTWDVNRPHTPTSFISSSHSLSVWAHGHVWESFCSSTDLNHWALSNICSEDKHNQTKINRGMNVKHLCLRVLPNGMFFQQPLDWDGQLPQEALDDWPTLGKLILHLNLQNVSGQRHKVKPLEKQTDTEGRIPLRRSTHSGTTVSADQEDDYKLQTNVSGK